LCRSTLNRTLVTGDAQIRQLISNLKQLLSESSNQYDLVRMKRSLGLFEEISKQMSHLSQTQAILEKFRIQVLVTVVRRHENSFENRDSQRSNDSLNKIITQIDRVIKSDPSCSL